MAGRAARKRPKGPGPDSPPFTPDQWTIHGRLSQCLVGFGLGAGPIRVRIEAVNWLYKRLWYAFKERLAQHPNAWSDIGDYKGADSSQKAMYWNEATQIIDLCKTVGRLAAMKATKHGSFVIEQCHVERAFTKVKNLIEEKEAHLPPETRGPYCIPEPGPRKK